MMLQKIIKSHTVMCILAVLLSIGFCQIGLAAETPTVRIGSAEGSVSDTVSVSINIANASVIGAMDIGLTYDASILKATNVVNGAMIESLSDALWSYNISSGRTIISFATYPDAINNDGELFIVTFDVVGGNTGDNSTLVTEVEAYTMDASPQPVAVDTEDGAVVVIAKRSGGSSSGSSSSSGGGGGGSSGETYENIEVKDVVREYTIKDEETLYEFKEESNAIETIKFTPLKNAGGILATVEVLKDTSALMGSAPQGMVYQNMNIWVGKTGFATSDNIADVKVEFKVEKSWIEDNDIVVSTIRLCRHHDDVWNPLPTKKNGEDDKYIYFESETPGFSPFAITGGKVDVSPEKESIVTEPTAVVEESPIQPPDEDKPGLPGFSLFAGVSVLLIAVQILREK